MTEDTTRPAGDPHTLGQQPEARPPVGPPSPVTPPPAGTPAPVSTQGTDQPTSASSGTRETAKEEAGKVAGTAKEQASRVAGTAKEETQRTVGEAKRQAQHLLRQGQSELSSQAGAQQERLAGGLRSFSSELGRMAEGAEEQGIATQVATWASHLADDAGRWLEERDPSSVMDEVRRYARRHPGTFMLVAAGLGLAVGRVARSLKDSAGEDSSRSDLTTGGTGGYGTTGYPTTTGYDTTSSTTGAPAAGTVGSTTTTTPTPLGESTGRPVPEGRPPGMTYGTTDQGGPR